MSNVWPENNVRHDQNTFMTTTFNKTGSSESFFTLPSSVTAKPNASNMHPDANSNPAKVTVSPQFWPFRTTIGHLTEKVETRPTVNPSNCCPVIKVC